MRICTIGDPDDLCAVYIGWLARERGAEVLVLAEHEFGISWTFELYEDPTRGFIAIGARRIDLSELGGVFVRFNPGPLVSESLAIPAQLEPVYILERRAGLSWLLDHLPLPVINRPSAGRSNSSKPYQMSLLERAGFLVPRWVVTNDRDVAEEFIDSCPSGAVYKACSGLRSRVRRADEAFLQRLEQPTAPVVVQEYVPGVDVRVHLVGGKTFAAELRSDALDYRFDGEHAEFIGIETPKLIAERCMGVAAGDGLTLAGFDFRVANDRTWWCLEMNPVPTFLPYEAGTGHAVGDAILDLLGLPQQETRDVSPLFRLAGRVAPATNG